MHSNFEFVRRYHQPLYEQLHGAEQQLGGDPCCFLLKLRLALELWCHDYADLRGIKLAKETSLAEKLQELCKSVQFPEHYLSQLQQLRQLCNQALHLQQDARGRHTTQQHLSRMQQLAALQSVFEFVSFNVRYCQPDQPLPTWQDYPRYHLPTLLARAFEDDADACAELALIKLEQKAPDSDSQYWFAKAVAGGSGMALSTLCAWQDGSSPALSLSKAQLRQIIGQYARLNLPAEQLMQLAQLAERQQWQDKAVSLYQKAARAGYSAATHWLLQHIDSDAHAEWLALGLAQKLPLAIQLTVLPSLEHAWQQGAQLPKATVSQFNQLLSLAIPSFPAQPYLRGLLQLVTEPPQNSTDWAAIAHLLTQGAAAIPASSCPDVLALDAALAAEDWLLASQHAERALQQQQRYGTKAELAQTQMNIAKLLLQCTADATPMAFAMNPTQLLQKACDAGNEQARQLLLMTKQANKNKLYHRPLGIAKAASPMSGLLQQLLKRSQRQPHSPPRHG